MSIINNPRILKPQSRPVIWLGSSKKDLLAFPREVMHDIGVALYRAQIGENPKSAKHWQGAGPGVYEIREDGSGGTYRAVYWVRQGDAVYVLHCFQKKSHQGIETSVEDIETVKVRMKNAKKHHETTYGKKTN